MEALQEMQMATVSDPRLRTILAQEGSEYNGSVHANLVFFFRCLLFQTLLYNLPKAQLAFASLLSTSLSILASDVMVHPRYVNW